MQPAIKSHPGEQPYDTCRWKNESYLAVSGGLRPKTIVLGWFFWFVVLSSQNTSLLATYF